MLFCIETKESDADLKAFLKKFSNKKRAVNILDPDELLEEFRNKKHPKFDDEHNL